MSKTICRICLRTDINTRDIDETLVDFHDEITEYAIYENSALKYCSVCEHLLRKFYNFRQKCRKANKVLKAFKRGKNRGYPSHLHELLAPSWLVCSIPSTFQFTINNDNLEPLLSTEELFIKQEKAEDELGNDLENNDISEATDTLQTNNDIQENFVYTDVSGTNYIVRTFNVSEILDKDQQDDTKRKTLAELADIDLEDKDKPEENRNPLSLLKAQSYLEKPQNCEEQNTNKLEVKQEDNSSDSSDTEVINELEKRIQATSKARRKKGSSIPKPRPRQPLKNMKEIEKVFDIQLFATEQEAKDELQLRKTSERYLSAEHKCEICYMVFKYSKQLEFHMQWHHPSAGEYECAVCSMRFQNRAAVSKHKNGAHYGKFKCKKCPLITYHKMAMAAHYQRHAGVIFTCKLCNHTFKHTSTYKTHMRLQHMTEHVCVTCALTFVSEKGLTAHRNKKHKTKSKVDKDATAHCAPCGLTFATEQVYTVHIMNTHSHKDLANAIIACKLCGVRFEDKEHLKDHKRSQHSKYPKGKLGKTWTKKNNDTYNCSICGVEGTSNTWVLKHVASAHPDSAYVADLTKRRQHMCETCGKCYTTIYALRDHLNTHAGRRPHACVQCPARFSSRSHLQLHAEWHKPARRACTHCGKKFVSASNLSNHMRFHIQDRRFKCSLCHKGFLHSATLREHIRGVHHNERRVRKLVKREAVTGNA